MAIRNGVDPPSWSDVLALQTQNQRKDERIAALQADRQRDEELIGQMSTNAEEAIDALATSEAARERAEKEAEQAKEAAAEIIRNASGICEICPIRKVHNAEK